MLDRSLVSSAPPRLQPTSSTSRSTTISQRSPTMRVAASASPYPRPTFKTASLWVLHSVLVTLSHNAATLSPLPRGLISATQSTCRLSTSPARLLSSIKLLTVPQRMVELMPPQDCRSVPTLPSRYTAHSAYPSRAAYYRSPKSTLSSSRAVRCYAPYSLLRDRADGLQSCYWRCKCSV